MAERKVPRIRFKGFEEDWEQRKLGEISQSFSGGTPCVGIREYYGGEIPFIRSAEINSEETELFLTEKGLKESSAKIVNIGDILYALYGATSGEVSRAKIKGAINQAVLAITPDKEYDAEYLVTWLYKNKQGIIDTFLQGGQGNLSGNIVKNLIVSFPMTKEQYKIGRLFWIIDSVLSLHQRKLEKLKILKKAMLEKMFPKNGEKVPEIRFSGFTEDWEQRKVSELADRYDNLRVPVAEKLRVRGTTPYYGANGIQDYVRGFTHDGEFVLVAEDGANDLKNYPVQYVNGRIWVNNHAHVLQAKDKIADTRFLGYAISRADIEAILVGGGRAKLNAEVLMRLALILPGRTEQIRLASFLVGIDSLLSLHQRKLEKLRQIKKSMLERMFV